ncbi:hypothetical protein GGX14DRAFT_580412 [Mycena pura]|uniref:Uncharacterized protein n=1 Tax=Mycena pura TaxID=153505 RepID=A0AAD6UKT5_9AGAR|nr:hypothetical protein GGX14DRAFT_580412 [Mycena pura]
MSKSRSSTPNPSEANGELISALDWKTKMEGLPHEATVRLPPAATRFAFLPDSSADLPLDPCLTTTRSQAVKLPLNDFFPSSSHIVYKLARPPNRRPQCRRRHFGGMPTSREEDPRCPPLAIRVVIALPATGACRSHASWWPPPSLARPFLVSHFQLVASRAQVEICVADGGVFAHGREIYGSASADDTAHEDAEVESSRVRTACWCPSLSTFRTWHPASVRLPSPTFPCPR